MKPLTPHDPLDDLIAAALHGDLTPEERAHFDLRLSNDPAARAAFQEAQAMHDLLEKTQKNAQPDPAFEQRMVSGVRRKLQDEQHRETSWESLLALWGGVRNFFARKRTPLPWFGSLAIAVGLVTLLAVIALGPITSGMRLSSGIHGEMRGLQESRGSNASGFFGQTKSIFSTITSQLAMANADPTVAVTQAQPSAAHLAHLDKLESHYRDELASDPSDQIATRRLAQIETQKKEYALRSDKNLVTAGSTAIPLSGFVDSGSTRQFAGKFAEADATTTPQGGEAYGRPMSAPSAAAPSATPPPDVAWNGPEQKSLEKQASAANRMDALASNEKDQRILIAKTESPRAEPVTAATTVAIANSSQPASSPAADAPAPDNRKLIRNANLDLVVKSFQETIDKVTTMTTAAGGYVDTSNSQKGGNGKLQGTVVVKVLPQNLDAFLLKLRDLGQVKNQSVSTDDVTKDYFDTQARLENSRRMETQLQDLLKREYGKVSDLLQVERELGRVRGEIEQMQGQLKLYDFQVQYATVTMQIAEKDLKRAAAYLLKETDDFSLFATDVEETFKKSRQAADDFKGQVLVAALNHNSGSDVSATLIVSMPPDQIEPFLAQIRSLGRVANFTRDSKRVAQDGGDSDQPADETLTEKDKIMVNVSIRSDDETRKQVALTVVTKAVDVALDQAKTAALANAGIEVLSSSLNKAPEGQSTAALSVRVPGKDYAALLESFRGLGRTAALSIQRNDNSGPGASGDDAPVIVTLSLTDDETPLQETEMAVLASDVDNQAQQIKKDAATAGVEVKASSFERQPDGTELAQMTFRLPMAKYPAFLENLKKLGKVESLSVRRDDRPDQTVTDDAAPAEISLQLHNQRDIVTDNGGLWATLRQTFEDGATALFGSVRLIGVIVAFTAPWIFTLVLLAWAGRRIYVWRTK